MTTCLTRRRVHLQYSAPVHRCVRRLWAVPPAERGSQQVVQVQWRSVPEPDEAREYEDDFGNRVVELRHARIEREWEFLLELTTQRDSLDTPRETNMPPQGLGAYLLPSARCDLAPNVLVAAESFGDAGLEAICAWTHAALQYDEAANGELWTASQALERGVGVCADYAHLMIAVCRARRIPARYIAGYNPAEGAMHAWCEVLWEGTWRAFDPTHGRAARADCVFVAAGRDERDCPPLQGTYQGLARARMKSWCRTEVVGDQSTVALG